jgi:hypothetical protein
LKGRIDRGTVSRWERGTELPQPWTRKKLAAIAEENEGCEALVNFFVDQDIAIRWRIGFAGAYPELSRLLTRLEICVLNAHLSSSESRIAHSTMKALEEVAKKYTAHLAGEFDRGELPMLFDFVQLGL